MADLLFKNTLANTQPVDLVFNASDDTGGDAELNIVAQTPSPKFEAKVVPVVTLTIFASAPAPRCIATVAYDNSVYRGPTANVLSKYELTDSNVSYIETISQTPLSSRNFVVSDFQKAIQLQKFDTVTIKNTEPKHNFDTGTWELATTISRGVGTIFGDLLRLKNKAKTCWGRGVFKTCEREFNYKELTRKPRPEIVTEYYNGLGAHEQVSHSYSWALRKSKGRLSKWDEANRPDHGKYVRPVNPPAGDGYIPPLGTSVDLLFSEIWSSSTNLIFGVKSYVPAGKIIPVREVYKVINSSDLRLVSTDQRIKTISMSMSIDMDSWTWGFSAEIGYDELIKVSSVSGNPVLVDATVNGTDLRFVVESVRKVRKFGKTTLSVTGRGFSAELSDTYSPDLTFKNELERTAQQLMNDALTINGVSLGWVIDWQIEDWLVPAGVWSHQGSYMSAVTTIANSVGAFVLPDFATKKLSVISRNKVKPWDMSTATADVEIPSTVAETESISWDNGNEYNAVYVSGSSASSVLGLVKRIGTAGDKHAPMVTDALITDEVAARLRGVYELSKFGVKEKRELSLPILPLTGIILPGTIVKYTDNGSSATGVVMGVNVNVGLPSIRQNITVETHV